MSWPAGRVVNTLDLNPRKVGARVRSQPGHISNRFTTSCNDDDDMMITDLFKRIQVWFRLTDFYSKVLYGHCIAMFSVENALSLILVRRPRPLANVEIMPRRTSWENFDWKLLWNIEIWVLLTEFWMDLHPSRTYYSCSPLSLDVPPPPHHSFPLAILINYFPFPGFY
jgi:hypothetical protein